jgi:hypothetical protein
MRKATVTYHAPEGDSEIVHMGGARFIDGEATEINSEDHPHLMSKIEGNQHFEVEMGEEQPDEDNKPRRGRPPKNRDLKAGIEEARDHDFEADRRANLAGRKQLDQKLAE